MRRLLPLLVTFIALLLTSCGKNSNNVPNASLRFFHAIPDSSAVSITYLSSGSSTTTPTNFASGIGYQTLNGYQDIPAGSQTINVLNAAGAAEMTNVFTFSGATQYTMILDGRAAAAGGLLLSDTTNAPASGNFKFRVVNVGSVAVDLYMLSAGQTVANSAATFSGIGVGATNNFVEYAKGTFDIVLTLSGTKTPVYDAGSATYADQQITTLVAYATGSSALVNGAFITGTAVTLPANPYTRLKMVQTTPDVPLMDLLIDNTVTFSNVPYQGVSSYNTVNSGTHTFKAQATATPGTFLANSSVALGGGKDYTIVANGRLGTVTLVPLTDVNFTPALNKARVRVVNVGLGGGSIDVLVNFVKQLSTVGVNSASDYLELDASSASTGTNYSFTFTTAGTTTGILTLPSVALVGGTRYTIYLVGNSPNLQGVVTIDN